MKPITQNTLFYGDNYTNVFKKAERVKKVEAEQRSGVGVRIGMLDLN